MRLSVLTFTFLLLSFIGLTQDKQPFPEVELETTKDRIINSNSFAKASYPKVIVFWVTTDRNSILEVNAVNDMNSIWRKEYQAQTIAISLDDKRQTKKVLPFIRSNNWLIDCYLDPEAKTMIALKGVNVPLTVIVDGMGNIVWRKEGFDAKIISEISDELTKLTAN